MKFRAILKDKYDLEYEEERLVLKPWHKNLILLFAAVAVLNVLAVIYIAFSSKIYFWDDATYWDIARGLASGMADEGGFWKNVYNSISQLDYNYVAALPSMVIVRLFGESRMAYVIGLVNMYLLPSYILIYLLARKLSKAPKLAAAIAVLLNPVMMFLTFNGFVDIGGLLMCLVCFNLYYTKNGREGGFWRYIIIGILLAAMIVWRRWYAFFAVSFITAMLADCVVLGRKWYNTAMTIAVSGLILLLGFKDFVIGILLRDYGNLYSGYKFSADTDFKLITRYFGLIYIAVLGVCSVVMGIKKKETKTLFAWVQIIVCLLMFLATQTHGQQHLLLYVPSLIVLTLITVKHITKEWMLLGISALAIVHTANVYIPREQPTNIQEIKHLALVPDFSMLPATRDDADEILALKKKLDTTVYDGDNLGVLASSFVINEDIIKNVQASMGEKSIRDNYVVSLPQVDSRDTDLSALYNVNYILAVFPAQTHLAEGSQTVVCEAVKSFESYTDIATAYEEVSECETVIGDMTVKLFHRVSEVKKSDIAAFEARLYK